MSANQLIIRNGTPQDLPRVLELVKELALYERALHEVENTVEQMLADGFGEQPIFGLIVAEIDGIVVGISVYYFRYSTWKGRVLYLEDILITENMRGQGIGYQLFEATAKRAFELNCKRMTWQVLDWNEPAINFYKKFNAHLDGEWVNGSLSYEQLKNLAQ